MSNIKIDERSKKMGFCCPNAMLTALSTSTREVAAKKSKLSLRTIKYSYAKQAAGTIACTKCGDCMLAKASKERK